MNRLVDDGRVLLHNGRALRGIGFRGSRTGERSTAAKASATDASRINRAGHKKSGYDSRQENLLHFLRITKNPLANACGFVSSGHADAPIRELRSQTVSQLLVNIFYFTTVSLRVSTIEKS